MRRTVKKSWQLLAIILVGTASCTETPDSGDLISRVDSLVKAELEGGPVAGFAVGIRQRSRLLLAKGYGRADLEQDVAVTPETVFRIGSITKQFTATAILKLAEAEKLALDDPVSKTVPEFDLQGREVTVRHLLIHTSGIRSYTSLGADFWAVKALIPMSHDDMFELLTGRHFDFEPGSDFLYNNSGYYLLGVLIEKITGQRYASHVEETLFEPLGMDATSYCDQSAIIPHRARGYRVVDGELKNAAPLDMSSPYAAGALCSNILDLMLWEQKLFSGQVLNRQSLDSMTSPAVLTDGWPSSYGFGLGIRTYRGTRLIAHGGGINGFATDLSYYPDNDLTVVVLANTGPAPSGSLSRKIAAEILQLPVPTVASVPLSPAERDFYVGTYSLPTGEVEIYLDEETLRAKGRNIQPVELIYEGDGAFHFKGNSERRLVFAGDGSKADSIDSWLGSKMRVRRQR